MPAETSNPIFELHAAERAARDYCATLPLEHFMESTPQQTQRKIAVSSFELVHAERPDVWCYNELLVQYPLSARRGDFGRVVPDNLIVLHDRELIGTGSFTTTVERATLFMAMEYVSESDPRKDYVANMEKYERVRMPYYLLFEPEKKLLSLYRLSRNTGRLASVRPNRRDRYPVPRLETEVGIHDDWMRFWFRGRLLPLPAELDAMRAEAERKLGAAEQKLSVAEAEIARLKAELANRT